MLDLGCRSGALTRHFLDGNSVVGLDVDPAALEKAAALGSRAACKPTSKSRCPSTDASFDAVVAGELFEHLQFPGRARRGDPARAPSGRRPRRIRAERVPHAEPASLPSRPSARGRSRRTCACSRPTALRELLAGFDSVELRFVGGRYARLNARLFARDLVFTATKPFAPSARSRIEPPRRTPPSCFRTPPGGRRRPRRPCDRPARRSRPCRR